MRTYQLALEALKRDARHSVGLSPEQAASLYETLKPVSEALENYKSKVETIRRNGLLSSEGQNIEVGKVRVEAFDQIATLAASVDRTAVVADLQQRVSTKVRGSRERAAAQQKDAPALAAELRQSVLPSLIKRGENMQISPSRTAEKLVLRAAEEYAANPAKAETVISSLSLGWPWCPDLPEGTLAQCESIIAQQVAADEQQALEQAQGVQKLLNRVIEAAQQELKELG